MYIYMNGYIYIYYIHIYIYIIHDVYRGKDCKFWES